MRIVYMRNNEPIFRCPNCGSDNTAESYPVVQDVRFGTDGEVIGCDCCIPTENADDYALRICEEMNEAAKESATRSVVGIEPYRLVMA